MPKSVTGVFQVQADDTEQTIKNVVDTYKLPQCVKFVDSSVQEIMSTDIKEAIDNLQSYSGEMLLTGVKDTAPVLFGHYKGMTGDPNSKFCRRSAVVIPLDNPEISEIEVQTPEYMDSDDYELFVLQNFSESAATPDFVEGTLYVDFLRTSHVQFLEIKEPESPALPPPVPPRLKSTHGEAPGGLRQEASIPQRPGKNRLIYSLDYSNPHKKQNNTNKRIGHSPRLCVTTIVLLIYISKSLKTRTYHVM